MKQCLLDMCWVELLSSDGTDAVYTLVQAPSPFGETLVLYRGDESLQFPRYDALLLLLLFFLPCVLGVATATAICHCQCHSHVTNSQTDGPDRSLTRGEGGPRIVALWRPLQAPEQLSGRGATAVAQAVLVILEEL